MEKKMNAEAMQAYFRMIDKKGEMELERARQEGTLDERTEKLYQLAKDDEVRSKLAAAQTTEEAQAVFAGYGLQMELGEVEQLGERIGQMQARLSGDSGELSEDELEQIAGGGFFTFIGGIGAAIVTDIAKDYLKDGYKWVKKRADALESLVVDRIGDSVKKAVGKKLLDVVRRS